MAHMLPPECPAALAESPIDRVTVEVGDRWLKAAGKDVAEWRSRAYLLALARYPRVEDVRVKVYGDSARPPVVHLQMSKVYTGFETELRQL
jgi:hypothetical protein